MRKTLLLVFFILGSATATFAQSDEFVPLPTITVEKDVNLRRDPSTARARLKTLKPATELRLIDQSPIDGFYRVIFGKGRLGWVWSKNVRIPADLTAATATPAAAGGPCFPSLDQCPIEGCGTPGSNQAVLNSTKRRQPTGTNAKKLIFADLTSLQTQANDLVGQHNELTQPERDSLASLTVSSGTVGEGKLVKVRGFIATGADPHPNSSESVNCKLTTSANNDFHITIVENAGEDEFHGVVVEMIPQDRNAGWTLTKLRDIKQNGKRVLIIGGLFYDNIHLVNDDPNHPIGGQPKRIALWEVHPITKFFVCTKASNNCSAGSTGISSGWKRLEDF